MYLIEWLSHTMFKVCPKRCSVVQKSFKLRLGLPKGSLQDSTFKIFKKAGFNIEDRIRTYYKVEGELANVFRDFAETIKSETLSKILRDAVASENAYVEEQNIEGEKVTLAVEKV